MADRSVIPLAPLSRGTGIDVVGRANVDDAGSKSLAASFGSIGEDAQRAALLTKKIDLERDNTNIVKGEGAFMQSTQEAISKLDPLAADYRNKVQEIFSTQRQATTEGTDLTTREAKAELETRLQHITNVGNSAALKAQEASTQQEAVRTYDTAANSVYSAIRKDPTSATSYIDGFAKDGARLTAGIAPDLQRKIDANFQDNVVTAKALGFADKGRYDLAKATLDNNMGTLNPAQEQKARYQIEAIENKTRTDSARFAANTSADISAKIADFRYNPDPTAAPPVSRDDLDKLRPQFQNNPGAWNALVHQLDEAQAVRLNGQRATTEALGNAQNHSLRNQSEADLAFNNMTGIAGKKPAELMTPDGVNAAGNFARDQGYVPSVFKAQIENAGKLAGADSNTPENQKRLSDAVTAFDRINELAPNTKWGFADDKGSSVLLASSMAKTDQISPVEAARRVLAMAPSDQSALDARGKSFNDQLKIAHGSGAGQTALKWEKDQVSSLFDPIGGNIGKLVGGNGTRTVAPEVVSEYDKRLKDNFLKVPNWDTAKAATDQWMQQNYGVTQVGDRNEVVKYAPEKYFDPAIADRVKDFGSKIINEDVQEILSKNKIIPGKNTFAPNLPGYRLLADDRTAKEAGQWEAAGNSPDGTSTRTPVTYRLQVIDAFGSYQDVNGPRYRLPSAQEIKASNSTFILNEDAAKREMNQPGEAAQARMKMAPPNKATGAPFQIPSAPDTSAVDTGIVDPNAPKLPPTGRPLISGGDAARRRAMDQFGNIP